MKLLLLLLLSLLLWFLVEFYNFSYVSILYKMAEYVQMLDSWNRKLWNNGRRGVRWTCWSVMLRSYQLWAGTNDGDDSRGGGVFK